MNRLPARRAVVTGGASGIGLGVVRRLLQADMSVFAVDRNHDGLAAAEQLGAHGITLDVTDSESRKRLVQTVGEIDYLVNSAGMIRVSPIRDVDIHQWRQLFAVNAESVFFITQNSWQQFNREVPS